MILAGLLALLVIWRGLLFFWLCLMGERFGDGLLGASGKGWRVALASRLPAFCAAGSLLDLVALLVPGFASVAASGGASGSAFLSGFA
jgi:hypothetical protein